MAFVRPCRLLVPGTHTTTRLHFQRTSQQQNRQQQQQHLKKITIVAYHLRYGYVCWTKSDVKLNKMTGRKRTQKKNETPFSFHFPSFFK